MTSRSGAGPHAAVLLGTDGPERFAGGPCVLAHQANQSGSEISQLGLSSRWSRRPGSASGVFILSKSLTSLGFRFLIFFK